MRLVSVSAPPRTSYFAANDDAVLFPFLLRVAVAVAANGIFIVVESDFPDPPLTGDEDDKDGEEGRGGGEAEGESRPLCCS